MKKSLPTIDQIKRNISRLTLEIVAGEQDHYSLNEAIALSHKEIELSGEKLRLAIRKDQQENKRYSTIKSVTYEKAVA